MTTISMNRPDAEAIEREAQLPLRQREFEDYMQPHYNEVAAIEAAGFEDDSWHNDVCVSFVRPILFHDRPDGRYIKIWSDARDPGEREMQGARFLVCVYDECDQVAELYNGDSLADALGAADSFDPTE